ncbi:MAG: hypothetical protein J3Q66DRAFT_375389 [Benniella sp.]|nr:MAG: hypothetical protein J3Q66DRAFT_375389 [Benniella sp.]
MTAGTARGGVRFYVFIAGTSLRLRGSCCILGVFTFVCRHTCRSSALRSLGLCPPAQRVDAGLVELVVHQPLDASDCAPQFNKLCCLDQGHTKGCKRLTFRSGFSFSGSHSAVASVVSPFRWCEHDHV